MSVNVQLKMFLNLIGPKNTSLEIILHVYNIIIIIMFGYKYLEITRNYRMYVQNIVN